jgi:hypothetical protein
MGIHLAHTRGVKIVEKAYQKHFLWDVIKDRLIITENIRQVLDCVTNGTFRRQGEAKPYDPAGLNPPALLYSSPKFPD